MFVVRVELPPEVARFVHRKAERSGVDEKVVVADLLQVGFEQKLRELYSQYQQGDISLGYLAEQLGVGVWQLYHLLEDRGLRTANI